MPFETPVSNVESWTQQRPLMLSANIVKQPLGALMQAGAQFRRYGYALNQPWDIDAPSDLVDSGYAYWQGDINLTAKPDSPFVPSDWIAAIRSAFARGVTCWADNESVGAFI